MHHTRRPRALKPLKALKHKPVRELRAMAAAIGAARLAADLSQHALAERIGCRAQQVSVWERALVRPREDIALRLSSVLGVPVEMLTGEAA
jgi:transcriptional regulator with XRE-family HTH domain